MIFQNLKKSKKMHFRKSTNNKRTAEAMRTFQSPFYSSLKWTSTWRYELNILDLETKPR